MPRRVAGTFMPGPLHRGPSARATHRFGNPLWMCSMTLAAPADPVSPEDQASVVLRLSGVSKSFGAVQAVQQVSFEVRDGEVLTLLGPSGCGKTTTLRLIMGLERCTDGEIVYRRQTIDAPQGGIFVPVHKRD